MVRRFAAALSCVFAFFAALTLALGNPDTGKGTHIGLVLALIWVATSLAVKFTMTRDLFLPWLNLVAISAWIILMAYRNYIILGLSGQPTDSEVIIFAGWVIGWPLVDILDWLAPRSFWHS